MLYRNLEFNINTEDLKPNCFRYILPKEPINRVHGDRATFVLTGCITSVTWDSVPRLLQSEEQSNQNYFDSDSLVEECS